MIQNLNEELFSFIKKSPTGFHAVHELANYLTEAGFERLAEGNTWNLAEGGKYFVTRNQSAIIAFKVSRKDYSGFHIAASHSDSPTLKIKESSEMNIENQYCVSPACRIRNMFPGWRTSFARPVAARC